MYLLAPINSTMLGIIVKIESAAAQKRLSQDFALKWQRLKVARQFHFQHNCFICGLATEKSNMRKEIPRHLLVVTKLNIPSLKISKTATDCIQYRFKKPFGKCFQFTRKMYAVSQEMLVIIFVLSTTDCVSQRTCHKFYIR